MLCKTVAILHIQTFGVGQSVRNSPTDFPYVRVNHDDLESVTTK